MAATSAALNCVIVAVAPAWAGSACADPRTGSEATAAIPSRERRLSPAFAAASCEVVNMAIPQNLPNFGSAEACRYCTGRLRFECLHRHQIDAPTWYSLSD